MVILVFSVNGTITEGHLNGNLKGKILSINLRLVFQLSIEFFAPSNPHLLSTFYWCSTTQSIENRLDMSSRWASFRLTNRLIKLVDRRYAKGKGLFLCQPSGVDRSFKRLPEKRRFRYFTLYNFQHNNPWTASNCDKKEAKTWCLPLILRAILKRYPLLIKRRSCR